jgi:hypothetical protein
VTFADKKKHTHTPPSRQSAKQDFRQADKEAEKIGRRTDFDY